MEKHSYFQNDKVKKFKHLEILRSQRDIFNFLQVVTFDKFMLANSNCVHMFYTQKIFKICKTIQLNSIIEEFMYKVCKQANFFSEHH